MPKPTTKSYLQILDNGKIDVIDNISAGWVQVVIELNDKRKSVTFMYEEMGEISKPRIKKKV